MHKSPTKEAARETETLEDRQATPRIQEVLAAMDAGKSLPEVRQVYGVVESESADALVVRIGDRALTTRRAASCLLEPKVDDQVLVAMSEAGPSFVLAVLVQGTRETKGGILSLDGDMLLRTKTGNVAIVSNQSISLTSGTEVSVSAPELHVRSLKTTFFSESLSYIGRRVEAEIDRLKVAAQALDSTIDRVSARMKRSYRTVDEVEHIKAKELDIIVEGNANLHAENALVSADKLVKLDGEQVHIG